VSLNPPSSASSSANAEHAGAARRRLRLHHALREPDGTCAIIYDLERTFVIDVPRKFRREICDALEGAQQSQKLAQWLSDEDLLTPDPWHPRHDPQQSKLPAVTDVSLDLSGSCNMACVYCFEDAIQSRIGKMPDQTLQASLDFAFKQAEASRRLALHFGSGEPLLRFEQLERLMEAANERGKLHGIEVSYDLTTNATLVSPEIASFLAKQPVDIRVSCDGPPDLHNSYRPMSNGGPSHDLVMRGLRLLLDHLGDRVTVNSVMCGRTRLVDLWHWAKSEGIRHFHVIKVGTSDRSDMQLQASELAEFREDLATVSDDLFRELKAGRTPIDFQPLTKVVRRLMIPQPVTRFCGVAGSYLGVAANGDVYPCFRHLGLSDYRLGNVLGKIDDQKRRKFLTQEAAGVDSRPVCESCWARYLCGGGCYADSVVYGPDRRAPKIEHCPFWRLEISAAIRLFVRLREADPRYCLRLFGPADPDDFTFLVRSNCS